jgi:hypothetical protein
VLDEAPAAESDPSESDEADESGDGASAKGRTRTKAQRRVVRSSATEQTH